MSASNRQLSAAMSIIKAAPKSGVAYVVLGWLLGLFGVHNYYAGYTRKATIQLLITLFSGFLCFIPLVFVQVWAIAEICLINKDAADVPFREDVSLVKILRIAAVAFLYCSLFSLFSGNVRQSGTTAVQSSGRFYPAAAAGASCFYAGSLKTG